MLNKKFNFRNFRKKNINRDIIKKMKITVRKEENEMEAVYEIEEKDRIESLKKLINDSNFGPCIEEQLLVYKNKRLKNKHQLCYYRIKANSIIILKYKSASTSSSNASTPSSVSESEQDFKE